ncbi:ATP-binding protein [Ruminococcus sp.]|uniref:ATP-binding protein n=1 Tax=Ruminococcus sp. TaxID=41978 RepID=UPI0039943EA4
MNSVQKEMIRLYAKQLRLPTFNNYEKVIRQLSADDGYAQFLIELMKQELAEAVQMNRLSKLEKSLSKIDLLIIDELSYLTFNRYQSEMLFQIISERSERASVIISTNLEFSQWTQLFENEMLLAALIDRVTFRSFVLNMNCSSSYRIDSTLNHD